MIYAINLPNDYKIGSDYKTGEDTNAMNEHFPGVEAPELIDEVFFEIHSLWPGLKMLDSTDFGGIFESATTPPENLPRWAWVTEMEENENGDYEAK